MVSNHAIELLNISGYVDFSIKVKESKNGKYPAYAVYVKTNGQKRGKHVFTLVYPDFVL